MTVVVIIFGVLTLIAGGVILINPEIMFGYLREQIEKLEIQVLAVVVRLVLGVLLIYLSDVSKFPLLILAIGWISIIAAISLAVIGRNNFKSLMYWALSFQKPVGRIGGFIAMCFGSFLVYAFV